MAGSVGVAVVVGVVLMSQATPTRAFNLDTGASYLLWEPSLPYQERETYFGYTVALYAAGSQAWALVGAPRANNTLGIYRPTDIPEPGSLYACPLQGREALKCAQIQVDPTGNVAENWGGDGGTVDMKNYGWLGGSLDLLQDDLTIALVVTCSPRWKNQIFASRDEDYYMNGACYWASFTQLLDKEFSYEPWNKIIPLGDLRQQRVVDPSTGEVIYYYQMGQAGLSAHIMKDGQGVVLGAPGVKNWAGTVTTVQEDSDWNIIDSRYKRRKRSNIFFTKTNVFTPSSQVQQLEYFGYSVTSGRFWGDEDYIVAGAPRADLTGRVYIFKRGDETRMEVEWVGLGSQLGSGYGHAVAAGDVTGDGWSELLVGAPLYAPNIAAQGSKAETSEAGMVVVYGRAGVGDLREAGVLQGAPLAPGARFGSTISVVGDLDRDGFNDVAVGAPYEDGGRGAVYIYRGGADGLQTKLSQKILASDLSQALKGFGVAISRGVDVDQNGYVDVGVGAYSGSKGAAAVLRTRTVATVASRVVSTVAVITELRAEVRLALCLTYDGKQVQKRVGMDVNGTVDENLTPRATFVTTNTSHVISKATLEQGVETCLTFVLNMKENLQDLERPLEVTFKFHSDDFDPGMWCCVMFGIKSLFGLLAFLYD
ncbi:integrin alpha-4 [Procambarus clarkii]|uniref:integrin alpha-4 n=1 Tax=Procambarus clarkii TaxID=6728 RepID=UPI003743F88C